MKNINKKILIIIFLSFIITTFAAITSLVSIQIKEPTPGSMEIVLFFSSPTIPKYNLSQKGTQLFLTLEKVENKIKGKSLDINKGFIGNINFQEDTKKGTLTLIFNFIGSIPKYNISSKLGSITLHISSQVATQVDTKLSVSKEEYKLLGISIDKKLKPPLIIINTENKLIPPYKTLLLKNPLRFVVDLQNTLDRSSVKSYNINVSPFITIRISQFSKEPLVTRLVFDLKVSYPKVGIKETDQGLVVGTEEILAKLPGRTVKVETTSIVSVTKEEPKEVVESSLPQTSKISPVPNSEKQMETPSKTTTDKFMQRVSLTFDRAEIRDVLKAMGQLIGMNIITDVGVQGRISVYLKDVTFKDAFYSLLAASDLGYIQQGEVLIVSTLDKMQKLESRELTTKIFPLKYFDSKKAKDLVSNINKNLIVATEENRNWLIISGPSSDIAKIESFVKSLDVPTEKVVTEVPVPPEKILVEKIDGNIYISTSLHGEDIKNVLQEIAKKTGRSVFIESNISSIVFVTLNRVLVDRALDLIIRGSGLSYEVKEGGEILVKRKTEEKAETPALVVTDLIKVDRIGNRLYITAELKKIDVREILKELGKKANINFVIDPKVSGEVEFYVNKVPVEELLPLLGRIVGFSIEKVGEINYIKPFEEKAIPVEVAKTKIYGLRYIGLGDIQRAGGGLIKNLSLSYDDKTGLLIAQGKEEDLKVLEELIARIDVPKKEEVAQVERELIKVEKDNEKYLISGDIKKVDIKEVIREIGKKTGINFVIDPKVSGEVELYLNKVELSEVLKILSGISNVSIEERDRITYVKPKEEKVAIPVEVAKTKIYGLRYIGVGDIQRAGGGLIKNLSLSYDDKTGLLIAQGKEEDLKVLEELISKIDIPKKEEVTMVAESIRLFILKYITVEDIKRVWNDLVERLKLSYDKDTKLLLARGSDSDLRSLEELISKIDREDVIRIKAGDIVEVSKPLLKVEKENGKLLISGDLRKADIREVIRELAKIGNISFIIDSKVSGEIDLYLVKVEWEKALELISKAGRVNIEKKDNQAYYMVSPIEEKIVTVAEVKPQIRTEKKELNYITFDILKPLVSEKAKDVSFRYDSRTSILFMEGPSDQIDEVLRVIKEIDKPTPQVRVDVNVLEVTRGKTKDLGIDWSTGAISSGIKISAPADWSSLRVSMISTEVSIPAILKALETQQDAKILAQPSMTTLSDKQTKIMIGDRVPLVTTRPDGTREVTYIDAGIILEVTPKVNPDRTITALIRPQVSTLSGFVQGVPQISTREAQTTVTLLDGQTLAIGGLIRTEDIESVNKVPILGDIPIIGELFKSKSIKQTDKELVILITLKILQ
ncbi:MAG: secretin N-terminal domain-containing protein [Dictyoglomaceae bacterium]